MNHQWNRRDFLRLAGAAGAVFASALPGWRRRATRISTSCSCRMRTGASRGRPIPMRAAPAQGRGGGGAAGQADFIIFTGDLTHSVDDPDERRRRMREFRAWSHRWRRRTRCT